MLQLGARYYRPSVGRFITLDPIRDSLNWYVYVDGNSINAVDPWGLAKECGKKKKKHSWTCKVFKPKGVRRWPIVVIATKYYWCLACRAECVKYCEEEFNLKPGQQYTKCYNACIEEGNKCMGQDFEFKAEW